jgi:Pyruvate/2-oxoglutarate dehydrogenase complex, dihydrolipoamide acyltransferase (E2) component, and related enzymes
MPIPGKIPLRKTFYPFMVTETTAYQENGMSVFIQMPKHGNTVKECLVVEWNVKEGDTIATGDILCSIETDKASFDVESTTDGTVLKLLVNAGDLAPVLANIAVIGRPGEAIEDTTPANPETAAPILSPAAVAAIQPREAASEHPSVSPRARRMAEKNGIDIASLAGSGIHGRITSRDIQSALDAGTVVKTSPLARDMMLSTGLVAGVGSGIGGLCRSRDLVAHRPSPGLPQSQENDAEIIPYTGIRKLIGERMHQSLMRHAQLTLNSSADAGGLLALRKWYKENAAAAGLPKISINDLICWIVARTLPAFPEVNALVDTARGTITRLRRVNLAVAIDTPRGLMAPVVENAHRMGLAELSRCIAGLAEECREGTINPDALQGGTFTISNLGGMGVESFTPILNTPQAAILGVCAIRNTPAPAGDGFVFTPIIGLSLTIDHQAVDGAPGAKFLRAVAQNIASIQSTAALQGAL